MNKSAFQNSGYTKEKKKEFAMSSRIKTGFTPEERMPANMPADFAWLKANRDTILEKYGSCLVVVFEQQVLGVGQTYAEALANAEKNLPALPEIITPIVKYISPNSARLRRVTNKIED
jgi:hypothetical protein